MAPMRSGYEKKRTQLSAATESTTLQALFLNFFLEELKKPDVTVFVENGLRRHRHYKRWWRVSQDLIAKYWLHTSLQTDAKLSSCARNYLVCKSLLSLWKDLAIGLNLRSAIQIWYYGLETVACWAWLNWNFETIVTGNWIFPSETLILIIVPDQYQIFLKRVKNISGKKLFHTLPIQKRTSNSHTALWW